MEYIELELRFSDVKMTEQERGKGAEDTCKRIAMVTDPIVNATQEDQIKRKDHDTMVG